MVSVLLPLCLRVSEMLRRSANPAKIPFVTPTAVVALLAFVLNVSAPLPTLLTVVVLPLLVSLVKSPCLSPTILYDPFFSSSGFVLPFRATHAPCSVLL
jgi:hypothetical protein